MEHAIPFFKQHRKGNNGIEINNLRLSFDAPSTAPVSLRPVA
jgi:hypothetical protein